MAVDRQRTTVSLKSDLYWRFQKAVAEKKIALTNDAFEQAIEAWLSGAPAVPNIGAVESMKLVLGSIADLRNHYQGVVLSWRLTRTEKQISGILGRELKVEALPADLYLVKILSDLTAELGPEDEYCTLTNVKFWQGIDKEKSPLDHSFLRAQDEAITRGLRVHRIFILEKKDAIPGAHPEERDYFDRHYEYYTRVREKYPEQIRLSYWAVSDLGEALERFGHFAFVRRWKKWTADSLLDSDSCCMVVKPEYNAVGNITNLRFVFSDGAGNQDKETKFYIDQFTQAAGLSGHRESRSGFIPG